MKTPLIVAVALLMAACSSISPYQTSHEPGQHACHDLVDPDRMNQCFDNTRDPYQQYDRSADSGRS